MKKFFRFSLLLAAAALVFSCGKYDPIAPADPDRGFTARGGLYAVMEGNFYASGNGALLYLGGSVASLPTSQPPFADAYAAANPGHTAGALLEDIFFEGDKLYMLCQKGGRIGGDGQLVVADAATFKMLRVYADLGLGADNNPEHLVVANGKAFIQYAVSDYETQSGIRVVDLASGTPAAQDIAGTFGDFTVDGATKCRMLLSRGRIFAPCGQKLVIINAVDASPLRTVTFPGRQVKDIVKGFDGSLYAIVSGTSAPAPGQWDPPVLTSPASVVRLDHDGNILSEKKLPADCVVSAASWSPNTGLCASPSSGQLFFFGENLVSKFYRYDTATGVVATIDLAALGVAETTGGYMCVDPVSGTLVVPVSSYTATTFALIDPATLALRAYNASATTPVFSCAGVDCSYRFKPSEIAR